MVLTDSHAHPDAGGSWRWIRDAVEAADDRGFDLVIFEDEFDSRLGQTRLDSLLLASTMATCTSSIGLVVATDTTHTEPFHLAKNLATLDIVSEGRAGWWPRVSDSEATSHLFGRKSPQSRESLAREAGDVLEVVRRLWDSWDDDAVIRDVATGRYVDRSRIHHIDFVGEYFSVRGPSITPRSPQGQLPVVVDSSHPVGRHLATFADVVMSSGDDEWTSSTDSSGRNAPIHLRTVQSEPRTEMSDGLLHGNLVRHGDGIVVEVTETNWSSVIDRVASARGLSGGSQPRTLWDILGVARPLSQYQTRDGQPEIS